MFKQYNLVMLVCDLFVCVCIFNGLEASDCSRLVLHCPSFSLFPRRGSGCPSQVPQSTRVPVYVAHDGLVSLNTHLWLSSPASHFIKARESPLTARHLRGQQVIEVHYLMKSLSTCSPSCARASGTPRRSSRARTRRPPGKRSASPQSCWHQHTCSKRREKPFSQNRLKSFRGIQYVDNKSFQVRNVKIARNELKETSLQCPADIESYH